MKIAVIGCGNIGSKRVNAIKSLKKTKIEMIIGRKKIKEKIDNLGYKIAKKINANYFTDINKVLKSDIKSVILSTYESVNNKFCGFKSLCIILLSRKYIKPSFN